LAVSVLEAAPPGSKTYCIGRSGCVCADVSPVGAVSGKEATGVVPPSNRLIVTVGVLMVHGVVLEAASVANPKN
jgi:hypothetical protein